MSGRPPILVIGMHRAGTSMIADLLRDLGVFMGWRRDIYGEALFFQGLNDWLKQLERRLDFLIRP